MDDDNKTTKDYGIQKGTILDLEPKTMNVQVDMPDGNQIPIIIQPSDTAHDVKQKIQDATGMSPDSQALKHKGREWVVNNEKSPTAKDFGIREGDHLKVDKVRSLDDIQKDLLQKHQDRMDRVNKRLMDMTIEEATEQRRKCYMWYARLAQPNKRDMKRKVQKLPVECSDRITVDDVELLPWDKWGLALIVHKMNALIAGDIMDESELDQIKSRIYDDDD